MLKSLFIVASLFFLVPLPGQAAPACGDIFRTSTINESVLSIRVKSANLEKRLLSEGLWMERPQLFEIFKNLKTGERLIVRGVAPHEAIKSLEQDSTGRVKMRATYGIKDNSVRPGFVIDNQMSSQQLTKIIFDLDRYASQGATMETFAAKYNNSLPLSAVQIRYNQIHQAWNLQDVPSGAGSFGYWLVYRVPDLTRLEHHPESKVRIPERVVNIPEGLELIGVLSGSAPQY